MDKRFETRIPQDIRFFVHVYDCKTDPSLIGVSVACTSVDFSIHGIQFVTGMHVFAGDLLNFTIGIDEPFEMYLLRGEIRWVRSQPDGSLVGILLQEAEGTDFDHWQANFSSVFSAIEISDDI